MKTRQTRWTPGHGWSRPPETLDLVPDLLLVFGSPCVLAGAHPLGELRAAFPHANLAGCSTAGEIEGLSVLEGSLVVTAVEFESGRTHLSAVPIDGHGSDEALGRAVAESLDLDGLLHVLILSDGINVNGSDLARGLEAALPRHVMATGGLSGDGTDFRQTSLIHNGRVVDRTVLALGFYGERLRVGHGCIGGWDPYGPERTITRSRGNLLFELDGKPALDLYRRYLGEHSADLPSAALLFPLSIRTESASGPVVRTILGIDEAEGSMRFAGDVPEGSLARFMKANFDRLIDGATAAARSSYEQLGHTSPDLAILISCVGRRVVLDQRVEEEVEGVQAVLGPDATLTGFYSYGEISPLTPGAACELHNQTMTITTLSER